MLSSPALEIIQLSCGLTCFGHLCFNYFPPVLVGLTCGNWPWDCVIVGLGVFSWFWGHAVVWACSEVEGEIGECSTKTSAHGLISTTA